MFKDAGKSSTATDVFNQILRDSYPGWTGFHECLTSPTPEHDVCWAELHHRALYRQLELDIDMSQANPVPSEVVHHNPYQRGPYHIAAPQGHGTANTREYPWSYLMATVVTTRLPLTIMDVDGDPSGVPPEMYLFHCSGTPTKIACHNSLGDAIAYTPNRL